MYYHSQKDSNDSFLIFLLSDKKHNRKSYLEQSQEKKKTNYKDDGKYREMVNSFEIV